MVEKQYILFVFLAASNMLLQKVTHANMHAITNDNTNTSTKPLISLVQRIDKMNPPNQDKINDPIKAEKVTISKGKNKIIQKKGCAHRKIDGILDIRSNNVQKYTVILTYYNNNNKVK